MRASNGIQGNMRKRLAAALLALTMLLALAPALGVTAEVMAPGQDCCTVAPPSCDGPDAACPPQLCQAGSLAAVEYAQAPGFAVAIPEAHWRERVVTPPELAVKPGLPVAQPGPPAYLRFHRFLL